jgi:Mg-chelatase subunit ChlD
MRVALFVMFAALFGSSVAAQEGLQIEIQSPSADFSAVNGETMVEVEGIASAIGGVRYLDMMFVMDTSQSLRGTDPKDYRSMGAIGLVKNLSPRSDIQIGVVSFSGSGDLVQPLTSSRDTVVDVLRELPRSGSTATASRFRRCCSGQTREAHRYSIRLHGQPAAVSCRSRIQPCCRRRFSTCAQRVSTASC